MKKNIIFILLAFSVSYSQTGIITPKWVSSFGIFFTGYRDFNIKDLEFSETDSTSTQANYYLSLDYMSKIGTEIGFDYYTNKDSEYKYGQLNINHHFKGKRFNGLIGISRWKDLSDSVYAESSKDIIRLGGYSKKGFSFEYFVEGDSDDKIKDYLDYFKIGYNFHKKKSGFGFSISYTAELDSDNYGDGIFEVAIGGAILNKKDLKRLKEKREKIKEQKKNNKKPENKKNKRNRRNRRN